MARISAAERRPLLVEAALRVLSREGVAGLSTRTIVAEAGMSLASFHYVYDSREHLLGDLIGTVIAGEREAGFAGLVARSESLDDALRGALAGYLAALRSDPGREQGMLELTQHALRTPGLRDLAAAQYERYRALARELLEVATERYAVSWDRPLEDLARFVIQLTDGLTLAWLADRDDEAAERLVDLAAESLLAHVRTPA